MLKIRRLVGHCCRSVFVSTVSKTAGRTAMSGGNQSEFWISDVNRAKLVDTVSGIFREELSKAHGGCSRSRP